MSDKTRDIWNENKHEIESGAYKKKAVKKVLEKAKKGNYSIYKIEGEGKDAKHTRMKDNMSASEMRHELGHNPDYKGKNEYGFGGRRTYPKKK